MTAALSWEAKRDAEAWRSIETKWSGELVSLKTIERPVTGNNNTDDDRVCHLRVQRSGLTVCGKAGVRHHETPAIYELGMKSCPVCGQPTCPVCGRIGDNYLRSDVWEGA